MSAGPRVKEGADRGSGLFVRGLVVEVLVVCVGVASPCGSAECTRGSLE